MQELLRVREAESAAGRLKMAHAPSMDCSGAVVPGSVVYGSLNSGAQKTDMTIYLCAEKREGGDSSVIGYHPSLAETAAKKMLKDGLISEFPAYDVDNIRQQVTFGKSRVDYVLSHPDTNALTLVEVKNVVGADYTSGLVPTDRCSVGVYERKKGDNDRCAIFPVGPTKPGIGCVSDRAIKHVTELTNLHSTVDAATGKTINSAILFVINRSDCDKFRPCHEADMLLAQCLLRARGKGVMLLAKEVVWKGSEARLGRTLPVVFDESVRQQDIDEGHLTRVLVYNEESPKR